MLGVPIGAAEGFADGLELGEADGALLGLAVGDAEGDALGAKQVPQVDLQFALASTCLLHLSSVFVLLIYPHPLYVSSKVM